MKNTVTQAQIDAIWDKAEKKTFTAFDKCLVMIVKLENGFILTESSACVDPANYDEKIGYDICKERIKNRLWEFEGYRLQCSMKGE